MKPRSFYPLSLILTLISIFIARAFITNSVASIWFLFQPDALFIVCVIPLFACGINFKYSEIIVCFIDALNGQIPPQTRIERGLTIIQSWGNYALTSGFLGTILLLMPVFEFLNDGLETIGLGISIALVSIFYGVFTKFVICQSIKLALWRKLSHHQAQVAKKYRV